MEDFKPLIGLTRQREKKRLTQKELGEKLGVVGNTIYCYEKGRRQPDIQTLKKLAEILNCKINDLI